MSSINNKIKDNQEYFIGFVRGFGGNATRFEPLSSTRTSNIGYALRRDRLKQPFLRQPPPTGYYETSENWIDTDSTLNKIVEANRVIEFRIESNHLVNYFKSYSITKGSDIIKYLISIYMNGFYDNEELKALYEILYVNDIEFDIDASYAEERLKELFQKIALMPKTHLQ